MLDPRDESEALQSHELEQALLGCILYENTAFVDVDGLVQPADFAEPFHGRLFRRIGDLIRMGGLAEPITLASDFAIDPAFRDLRGVRYLADLVEKAPPSNRAPDYAKGIRELALRRQVIKISTEIATRARTDPMATGEQLMADMERQMLAARSGKGADTLRSFGEVAHDVVFGADRPDDRPLVKFGLKGIDDAIGGAERGDLIVLGARPSMGKSALASCIALNVALAGFGVAEVNGEMTTEQMARRHLSDFAFTRFADQGPTYRDIRRRLLSDQQWQILQSCQRELKELPLHMVKRTGLTLGRLRAMLRRQKMLWEAAGVPFTLAVIDHVGLLRPDEGGRSRNDDQTMVSAGLKEMAEELDVVMLALAQLNREVEKREDKRPQLSDLRDSGSWEQDADIVMGVYRDAYYARREKEPKGREAAAEHFMRASSPYVEVPMLKIREGDVTTVRLWADIGRNAIRDADPTYDDAVLI